MIQKIYLEISPSNRCKCNKCGELIPKGVYRLVEKIGAGKWVKIKKFCPKCGEEYLKFDIMPSVEDMMVTLGRCV